MEKTEQSGLLLIAGLTIAFVSAIIYLLHPPPLSYLEDKSLDWVMDAPRPAAPSGSVAVVEIDDESLSRYGQWPWSRDKLARLLKRINDYGAKNTALTILLAEPDRMSLPQGEKADAGGVHETPNDLALSETLKGIPCILAVDFKFKEGGERRDCRLHPLSVVWLRGPGVTAIEPTPFEAKGVICNLDVLSDAAAGSGFLNAIPDTDGILRRMPVLIRYKEGLYPSLALAALIQAKGVSQVQYITGRSGAPMILIGDLAVPLDDGGNVFVDFAAPGIPRIAAGRILEGDLPEGELKGRSVILGCSAAGLSQVYRTPKGPVFSSAQIHAELLETLLKGGFAARTRDLVIWEVDLRWI